MTGQAHTAPCVSYGLAVLPMATPDADFMACYDRIAENLTRPLNTLALTADVVLHAHATGQISDHEFAGVSASRHGITHTAELANSVLRRLLDDAVNTARLLLDRAGMIQSDDSGIDLFAELTTDYGHGPIALEISLASNCRVAEVDDFMGHDLPAPLRRLANAALYRLSLIGPLCSYVPVLMSEDEMAPLGALHAECPELMEIVEHWCFEGCPDWEKAQAEVYEYAASEGVDTDDATDMLNRAWPLLHSNPTDDHPELQSVPTDDQINSLIEAAQACGHDHALIDFARAVVALDQALTDLLAPHKDTVQVQADMSCLMLMITTNARDFQYASDQADMTMNSGESPHITVATLEHADQSALRDVLASYYAQSLAFEAIQASSLCKHHADPSPVNTAREASHV